MKFISARLRAIGVSVALLGLSACLPVSSILPAHAQSGEQAAQVIANHFSKIRTMSGEFVQFGPRGEQTGGRFVIERPGKIRFDYEKPSTFRVVADGKSVVINNRKLKTWDLYPLSKTPLKLLLQDHIDLSNGRLKNVRQEPDLLTMVMSDKAVFGNAKLTMMFDPNSKQLRQWTITDAQGKDTTVMIFNVQEGVKVPKNYFKIDYNKVARSTDTIGANR